MNQDASTTRPDIALRAPSKSGLGRVVLMVIVLGAGFAATSRITHSCENQGPAVDAPDFTAAVIANGPEGPGQASLNLAALRGRPVLLDFWATWCPPCQVELPIINGLAARFKDRGLVVVGVNTSDKPGLAADLVVRRAIGFPIVSDEDNAIAQKYNVDNLPTLILVSKEGKVVAVRRGVTSDAELERLVRRVL
ncbi:MAG: TlpA family protein disulfide reductase [Polyangiaceae bacterium]|nr:TlpA family protein disulfide reductase [Polyangiaceae bacterium]